MKVTVVEVYVDFSNTCIYPGATKRVITFKEKLEKLCRENNVPLKMEIRSNGN